MTAGWQHPRIANPAVAKDEWEAIAIEAQAALWRRRTVYSSLVDHGASADDKEKAKAEGVAWKAIADDWDWIATGVGEPADSASLTARIVALDDAVGRFFQLIDQQGHMTREQSEQGALIAAMRWWAEAEMTRPPHEQVRFLAGVGHHWREANDHVPIGKVFSPKNEQRKAA